MQTGGVGRGRRRQRQQAVGGNVVLALKMTRDQSEGKGPPAPLLTSDLSCVPVNLEDSKQTDTAGSRHKKKKK